MSNLRDSLIYDRALQVLIQTEFQIENTKTISVFVSTIRETA